MSAHVILYTIISIKNTLPIPARNPRQTSNLKLSYNIAWALDSLPEIYRHVFLLHRFDGMTYKEIGEALQLPARTVERYAVKALTHCFAKYQECA
jgi:RNA polymerase sigma factor (sigma-70 family)